MYFHWFYSRRRCNFEFSETFCIYMILKIESRLIQCDMNPGNGNELILKSPEIEHFDFGCDAYMFGDKVLINCSEIYK